MRFKITGVIAGAIAMSLSGCTDNFNDSKAKSLVESELLKLGDRTMCMNSVKIKEYASDNVFKTVTENNFPVVFAEEAFVKWSEEDKFIAVLLMGDKLIAVHSGGYERAAFNTGHPGAVLDASSYERADAIFEGIRTRGAVIDLTAEGRSKHAWADNNFCVTGHWAASEISKLTEPAVDGAGKTVSHFEAKIAFQPTSIGGARLTNPLDATLYNVLDLTAVKYQKGWEIDDFPDK